MLNAYRQTIDRFFGLYDAAAARATAQPAPGATDEKETRP
jgi:hypothetical protein